MKVYKFLIQSIVLLVFLFGGVNIGKVEATDLLPHSSEYVCWNAVQEGQQLKFKVTNLRAGYYIMQGNIVENPQYEPIFDGSAQLVCKRCQALNFELICSAISEVGQGCLLYFSVFETACNANKKARFSRAFLV